MENGWTNPFGLMSMAEFVHLSSGILLPGTSLMNLGSEGAKGAKAYA